MQTRAQSAELRDTVYAYKNCNLFSKAHVQTVLHMHSIIQPIKIITGYLLNYHLFNNE